jgi:hypothetical protein
VDDITLTLNETRLPSKKASYVDSDGDKYTVSLTGPGSVSVALDDPDFNGKGGLSKITLNISPRGEGDEVQSIVPGLKAAAHRRE